MPLLPDIEQMWAPVLTASSSTRYITLLDTRTNNPILWHFIPRVGLWYFWNVATQVWVLGTPASNAVLINCETKPI